MTERERIRSLFGDNWLAITGRGLVAVIAGVVLFLLPLSTLNAVVLTVGVVALFDGLGTVVPRMRDKRRGIETPGGLGPIIAWVQIIFGAVALLGVFFDLFTTGLTTSVVFLVVGIWAIVMGGRDLLTWFQVRNDLAPLWPLLSAGLTMTIVGILVILRPGMSPNDAAWLIGAGAIVWGVLMIIHSWMVRTWKQAAGMSV